MLFEKKGFNDPRKAKGIPRGDAGVRWLIAQPNIKQDPGAPPKAGDQKADNKGREPVFDVEFRHGEN